MKPFQYYPPCKVSSVYVTWYFKLNSYWLVSFSDLQVIVLVLPWWIFCFYGVCWFSYYWQVTLKLPPRELTRFLSARKKGCGTEIKTIDRNETSWHRWTETDSNWQCSCCHRLSSSTLCHSTPENRPTVLGKQPELLMKHFLCSGSFTGGTVAWVVKDKFLVSTKLYQRVSISTSHCIN